MKLSNFDYRVGAALALAAAVVTSPARAEVVLLGSDYFQTVQPTFFIMPPGPPNPPIPVMGVPIGPGTTDTIVQRQGNCFMRFPLIPTCTIPIEMVALSLVTTAGPQILFRESPTLASVGMMTMFTNPSGTGGTFDSFFDIFIEFSLNGGSTFTQFDWNPNTPNVIDPLHLVQTGATWTAIEPGLPVLLVDGLIGDQNANRHTNKPNCDPRQFECPVDLYLLGGGVVTEVDVLATHTAQAAVVPEPGSLALVSLALAAMAGLCRRKSIPPRHGSGWPVTA